MPGCHPGKDRGLRRCNDKCRVVQRVQLAARQHRSTGVGDTQIDRNACGSARVVAGDHDHADAGPVRLADGDGGLGARRVDDAHRADVDQALFQVGRRIGVGRHLRVCGQRAACHGQRAQRGVGHAVHVGQDAGARGIVKPHHRAAQQHLGAVRQQHIGCTFGEQDVRAAVGAVHHQRRHHLALRGERNLANALVAGLACGGFVAAAQLVRRHQEGGFCRVALNDPCSLCGLLQLCVTGQATAAQHSQHFVAQRPCNQQRLRRLVDSIDFGMPLGHVAHARDGAAARCRHHALDRHLAACQRAGLVRSNH